MRFVYSEELWFEEELFCFYYIFGVDLVFFCRCGCDWVFLVIGRGIWYLVKGKGKKIFKIYGNVYFDNRILCIVDIKNNYNV